MRKDFKHSESNSSDDNVRNKEKMKFWYMDQIQSTSHYFK